MRWSTRTRRVSESERASERAEPPWRVCIMVHIHGNNDIEIANSRVGDDMVQRPQSTPTDSFCGRSRDMGHVGPSRYWQAERLSCCDDSTSKTLALRRLASKRSVFTMGYLASESAKRNRFIKGVSYAHWQKVVSRSTTNYNPRESGGFTVVSPSEWRWGLWWRPRLAEWHVH